MKAEAFFFFFELVCTQTTLIRARLRSSSMKKKIPGKKKGSAVLLRHRGGGRAGADGTEGRRELGGIRAPLVVAPRRCVTKPLCYICYELKLETTGSPLRLTRAEECTRTH